MLLYQNGDIRIKSAKGKNENHLALSNKTSLIFLNIFEFQLWLNFISNNLDYDRAVLHKSYGQIEILNNCRNFMLIFSSGRGFFTKVLVRKEECHHILQNRSLILKRYNRISMKTELPENIPHYTYQSDGNLKINNTSKSIHQNENCNIDIEMDEVSISQKNIYTIWEDQYGEGLYNMIEFIYVYLLFDEFKY